MKNGRSIAPAFSFLRACRGEPVVDTPIWLMRQAGRYLPEYRAVREKHSFLDVCRVPEICAEVTAQPIERFGFDAAIIFQDILIPLMGMGVPLDFDPGPRLGLQIQGRDDVARLRWEGAATAVPHLQPVIRAARERLKGQVPLIGFAGAPFTLAAYLIDGSGSRDLSRTRGFLARDPEGFAVLMELLSSATIDYLRAQIGAGVDAVMLFDTQAGWLPPAEFAQTAVAAAKRVLRALPRDTTTIHFALAPAVGHLEALRTLDASVLGLDYRVSLAQARAILGNAQAVQGNLDPAALLGSAAGVVSQSEQILRENGGRRGFIFNLGHGILPTTPIENVQLLIDTVRRFRASSGGVL